MFGFNTPGRGGSYAGVRSRRHRQILQYGGLDNVPEEERIRPGDGFGDQLGRVAGMAAFGGLLGSVGVPALATDLATGGSITSGLLNPPEEPGIPGADQNVAQALGNNPYASQGAFGPQPLSVLQSYDRGSTQHRPEFGALQQYRQQMGYAPIAPPTQPQQQPNTNWGEQAQQALERARGVLDRFGGQQYTSQPLQRDIPTPVFGLLG